MSLTESHWMPEESANAINPDPHSRQVVGVIKGEAGMSLDRATYLRLLGDRLDLMIEQESEGPEGDAGPKQFLQDNLNQANLPEPESLTGSGIVQSLRTHLSQLNIPGQLPTKFPVNDPAAQTIFEETDLESWVSALLTQPTNPDR